jgi:hypothetical protein
MPIKPSIIEYDLALLPAVIPSHALARLNLLSVGDSSPRPLSAKLLDRPRMLWKIAAMIPNRQRCHLIPCSTTGLERDIALTLGIRCAIIALPVAAADRHRVLAVSVLVCERVLAQLDGRRGDSLTPDSERALGAVPQATQWADCFTSNLRPRPAAFRRQAAPHAVRAPSTCRTRADPGS